jgi:hypothetical protein
MLLVVYILTLLIMQSISIGVGLLVDRYYSSYAGLMLFIALYFFMFWLAWQFAVRITKPKSPPQQS